TSTRVGHTISLHDALPVCEEFLDFFEDIERGRWHIFSEQYTHFLKLSDLEKKDFSQKRFKAGVEAAADIFGLGLDERKNRQNLKDRKSNTSELQSREKLVC